MAQLVARLVRNEKVRSSNLLSSTTTKWPRQFRGHFSSWLSFVLVAQVGTCASSTKLSHEGGSQLLVLSVDKKFVAVVRAGLLGPWRRAVPKRRASAIDAAVYLAQVVDPLELACSALECAWFLKHDVYCGLDLVLGSPNQLGCTPARTRRHPLPHASRPSRFSTRTVSSSMRVGFVSSSMKCGGSNHLTGSGQRARRSAVLLRA